jgi:hypothetical protein
MIYIHKNMMIRNIPHKSVRMYDVRTRVNVSTLYPLAHRLDHRTRRDHLDLSGVPMTDDAKIQLQRFRIMVPFEVPEDEHRLVLHRVRGERAIDPAHAGHEHSASNAVDLGFIEHDLCKHAAVLCVCKENAMGGLLKFVEPGRLPLSLECIPGTFIAFEPAKGPFQLTGVEPIAPGLDSHMDLVWLIRR